MRWLIGCVAVVLFLQEARAGEMETGCVGKTGSGARIAVNETRLVIMDADLAAGVLRKNNPTPQLDAYMYSGVERGGQVYSHTWEGGRKDKVVLREKDTKVIKKSTESAPCERGVRDITYTLSKKTFELHLPEQAKPETIKLDCYVYQVTTCG